MCGANVERGVSTLRADRDRAARREVIERRNDPRRGVQRDALLARELGLGADAAASSRLDTTAAPGTPSSTRTPRADARLVWTCCPTPRPALATRARARVAGVTGLGMRLPALEGASDGGDAPAHTRRAGRRHRARAARVEMPRTTCRAIAGVTMRGVRVGPSPQWLVDRLAGVGRARSTTWWTRPTTCCTSWDSRSHASTRPAGGRPDRRAARPRGRAAHHARWRRAQPSRRRCS